MKQRRIGTLLSLWVTRHHVYTIPSFSVTSINTNCAPYLCFTCFLIGTLQSCTPAAALFSPHCPSHTKFPQHSLNRNNFVTTLLYLLLFQGIQVVINRLELLFLGNNSYFFCIFTHFHIKWKSHMSNVSMAIGLVKTTIRGWKQSQNKHTKNQTLSKHTQNPRNAVSSSDVINKYAKPQPNVLKCSHCWNIYFCIRCISCKVTPTLFCWAGCSWWRVILFFCIASHFV